MDNAILAGDITIIGHAGDEIPAYAALPQSAAPAGGVVVIHHMPGFDWGTKEIVRRVATWGFASVCPNLHHRAAPGADADDAAAASRAAGGVPDDRLVGDVGGARDYLVELANNNGRTGVIGFCSGGRQSVLAACRLPFDAAVDCYGAFVLTSPPGDSTITMQPLTDELPNLQCPLLGLFGNEDQHPAPDEVAELDQRLDDLGKPHEFHQFDDAGHAFLSADRPGYRQAAAVEGWRLIHDFFAARLATNGG